MKKSIILSILLLSFTLCACTSSKTSDYPTFGASAERCADAMGTSLEGGGTYNAFAVEPTVSEEESETFGTILCYSYPVCDGVYALLYENKNTELCYQLSLSVNWSEVNTWDNSIDLISGYMAILILTAEQDNAKAEDIASQLGLLSMGDAYADTNMTAESDTASYSYTTQNKFTMLNVIAK
ncbi:hypothetical protein ACTQ34_07185 [Agathobaculum sp. LCP25S3_E8]|uniref:hypothetical protein n=1 Tax=Agathobaculum sp. LCP25S3_E8 TaxID=3438735 RepID=UPI003F91ED35